MSIHDKVDNSRHRPLKEPGDPDSLLSTQIGGDHYKDYPIQPIEFLIKNNIPYPEGEAILKILRHREKGGAEDLSKAIHTLEILRSILYGE